MKLIEQILTFRHGHRFIIIYVYDVSVFKIIILMKISHIVK